MMSHLHEQILEWQNCGNFLVVDGDWNQYVQEESWKNLWHELNLVTPQSLVDSPPLSTYARGNHQTDNLYVSASLISAPAGCVSSENIIPAVDHLALWVDIADEITGFCMMPVITYYAQ